MPAFGLPLAAAYVAITASNGIIWSLLVWCIRLFIRLRLHGPFSWDDIFCTIATVLGTFQSCSTILQTHYGLGSPQASLNPKQDFHQHFLAWLNILAYIPSLCFSMLSVCFLIVRVTKRTWQVRLAYMNAAATVLWGIISMFLFAFACELPDPWNIVPRSRCMNMYHLWLGITVVKVTLELGYIFGMLGLLSNVRMPLKTKAVVLLVFLLRLLVIPPTVTRLRYIEIALASTDWSFSRVNVVIITQIVMHLSIILCTLPCIRPYLLTLESGALQAAPPAHRQIIQSTSQNLLVRPHSATLLSVTRPSLKKKGSYQSAQSRSHSASSAPGRAGHRQRVEEWQWENMAMSIVTKVEHDPKDAEEAARRRSWDTESSCGILRSKSFSLKFEKVKDYKIEPSNRAAATEGETLGMELQDLGGLLNTATRESTVEPQTELESGHDILRTKPVCDRAARMSPAISL